MEKMEKSVNVLQKINKSSGQSLSVNFKLEIL